MDMLPVLSSYVNSAGYDPDTNTLQINYFNGTSTTFVEVPPRAYDDFRTSLSKGSYVRTVIERTYDST